MWKKRFVLLVALVSLMWPRVSSGQAKQYRIGQTIELANNLKLRVISAGAGIFSNVKLTGVAKVFELQFERNGGPIVSLDASTDSANTGVQLIIGESRFAPKVLGTKKGADLEAVMVEDLAVPKDTGRGQWISFGGQSTRVQWLFDVPKELANKPSRLLLEVLVDLKQPPIAVEIVE